MPDAAMIFCAGFGTRMRPLTDLRPKPLIEVGGRTLLDRALGIAEQAGVADVVVNTHYLADQVEDHLRGRAVTCRREAPDILDTGGGLKAAVPLFGAGSVFTLNPDAVFTGENPLAELRRRWDPARMDALLLLADPKAATGRIGPGDFSIGPDGQLTRGGPAIYTGAQIIATAPVAARPERVFSLNRVWDDLIDSGRLFGLVHAGGWCDVGRPEGIALAEALLAEAAGA